MKKAKQVKKDELIAFEEIQGDNIIFEKDGIIFSGYDINRGIIGINKELNNMKKMDKIEKIYGKENKDCCASDTRLKKYLIKAGYKSLVKLFRIK